MAPVFFKALGVVSLCAVSAVGGHYCSKLMPQTNSFRVGLLERDIPIGAGGSLSCSGVGTAVLREHPFYSQQVDGSLGAGDDKVAIKIAEDGKSVLLLTAAAIEIGRTDAGNPIPIVSIDGRYIFAVSTENKATDVLLIDRKKRLSAVSSG